MSIYRFVSGVVVDKEYPDLVTVYIKRADALNFAMNILRQIEFPKPDENPLLDFTLCGQIENVNNKQ